MPTDPASNAWHARATGGPPPWTPPHTTARTPPHPTARTPPRRTTRAPPRRAASPPAVAAGGRWNVGQASHAGRTTPRGTPIPPPPHQANDDSSRAGGAGGRRRPRPTAFRRPTSHRHSGRPARRRSGPTPNGPHAPFPTSSTHPTTAAGRGRDAGGHRRPGPPSPVPSPQPPHPHRHHTPPPHLPPRRPPISGTPPTAAAGRGRGERTTRRAGAHRYHAGRGRT